MADLFEQFRAGKANLSDLVRDYACFNHSALMTYGGMPFDPVGQFSRQDPSRFELCALDLAEPLFQGLTGIWNQRLVLCPTAKWPTLYKQMLSISWHDANRNRFGRATSEIVWIDDVVALKTTQVQAAAIPTRISVTMFGVDCSDIHIGFARPAVVGPIQVVALPINPKLTAAAHAITAGQDPGTFLAAESSMERLGQSQATMLDHVDPRHLKQLRWT